MTAGPDIRIEELAARLTPGLRLAGLDLGTKTIGIALSDPGLSWAFPVPYDPARQIRQGCRGTESRSATARRSAAWSSVSPST
jgi:hypothetical protein